MVIASMSLQQIRLSVFFIVVILITTRWVIGKTKVGTRFDVFLLQAMVGLESPYAEST